MILSSFVFDRTGSWVHAVETFEILSVGGLIFACIYAAVVNCFSIYSPGRSRLLEIIVFVSGKFHSIC